ncbi:GTP pyrophosphokinase family protein [Plantibacter sp. VKM Ac-2885]|jgi:putative GTP pyrophosphokinase|uniref:GTP pyrophosphokinase n=3 Tax=Plantibacter TaxID=190323 RepID=A0ABY1RE30_9MICO|nr:MULTISPECIES: GTP pyrophosphokinase family protein [Plantibacter]MBD8103152.1 GTP pyrophosphokinase family protein [Plantibacter sp. CFBP 8775]MBD8466127.1 GTP pyrophosphokinase family protein [Plantibacter sp. CFBP 8798]MBD8515377.1 GTP pyrophosphokinase family protein [Plantibacter sp. CFBP 8804]MBD8534717.1 GTP pyrophosphokinase family protein [Plantibacter sp. CFBP 13570]MBF4513208.1 GTP pyrophosphokinase family protein [Plantibacter sp. VKM Ac-2885]
MTGPTSSDNLEELKRLKDEFTRFMMLYKFGIDEITTKLNILKEEFTQIHDYNPIEHISSRLKSPESIIGKIERKQYGQDIDDIREHITDIAGIRVTCSFISDTYKVFELLTSQQDITVVKVKDYIANPKPNGYQSLHVIVEVPVFMSDGVVQVPVEIQFRTIAMDFWASLEHKIYYKYDKAVPDSLLAELKHAAEAASRLDAKMEHLHGEVLALDRATTSRTTADGHPKPPSLADRVMTELIDGLDPR